MKGIIVFDEASIPLASVGFDALEMHQGLFTSFISAMQSYACGVTGGEVTELEYGSIRIMFGRTGNDSIVTIHSTKDRDAEWNHDAVVDLIAEKDYILDDGFLALLKELLTDDRLSIEEARIGIESLWKE
ncbi:MAG: hypothetical protein ACFFEF_03235 [Candidatus Thorarchaeota archaeon]